MKLAVALALCLVPAVVGIGTVLDASVGLRVAIALAVLLGCLAFGRALVRPAGGSRNRE